MATPISSANIALSELNTEPGGGTYSDMRFANLARPGWSEGTFGSGTYGNYTWGIYGASSGADAIYGLTPTSGAFSIGNFSGLTYYFDGSTFDVKYRYTNSLTVPGPPNPANSSQATSPVGGIVPNQFVLPRNVYWIIRVNTDAFNFGGGQLDFEINGTALIGGAGLAPGANNFNSGTFGSALTNGSGILMDFLIY